MFILLVMQVFVSFFLSVDTCMSAVGLADGYRRLLLQSVA